MFDCWLEDQAIAFDLNAYLLDPENLYDRYEETKRRMLLLQKLQETPMLGLSDSARRSMLKDMLRQVRPIQCADGLELSVQASTTHYCSPRDSVGPWTAVEVGFPTERVEELMEYAENPNDPTDTVYGWVPVAVIEAIVEKHGGIAGRCLSESE